MSIEDIKQLILINQVFPRPLSEDALKLIYYPKVTVWEEGNRVAHEAVESLIRDAVINGGSGDRGALETIFQCVYNKDL